MRKPTLPDRLLVLLAVVGLSLSACGRKVDPRLQEGYDLVVANRIDEAVAIANRVLTENPKSAGARNLLGLALYKSGDAEGAVEQYRRAIEQDPKYAEAYFNLGTAYERLERLQDAETAYASAVRHQEDFVLAHYNLGHIYAVTGRPDQAMVELRRAAEGDPQFPLAFILLGKLAYEAGDFEAATSNLTRALELVPTAKEMHVLLGNARLQSGAPDALAQAEGAFRAAVDVDSTYVDGLYSLGMCLAAQGRNEEAAAFLRRARPFVEGRPDQAAMMEHLDSFFARTGLPAASPDSAAAAQG